MLNLHVVFTMNPSSEGLKDRAATSPALFNRFALSRLLSSSGFSHHLEWYWISIFHVVLSNTYSSFNPILSISLLHESFHRFSVFLSVSFLVLVHLTFFLARALRPFSWHVHLVVCLPLRLFPCTGASNILLSTCPWSLLFRATLAFYDISINLNSSLTSQRLSNEPPAASTCCREWNIQLQGNYDVSKQKSSNG